MNRCGFTYLCRMISGMCLGLIVSCGSSTPESQQPRSIAPSRHGEPQIYCIPSATRLDARHSWTESRCPC